MNVKKIILIIVAIIILLSTIIISINFLNKKSITTKLKENLETGISYVEELKIESDKIQEIKEQKESADNLYKQNNHTAAKESYTSISMGVAKILKSEAERLLDNLEKYANSTAEQQTLFNEANIKAEQQEFLDAFNFYKSNIQNSNSLIEKYKKEAEELKPVAEENIAKEIITRELNKDYKVSDIKILVNGTWAVATVQPLTFQTDNAYIALQYLNNKWRIIAGPGTSFNQKDYPNMPEEVANILNGGQ